MQCINGLFGSPFEGLRTSYKANMSSKEEVLRIARLARIEINENEVEEVQKKFSSVLEKFNSLNALNTEGVEPMFYSQDKMNPRNDVPEPAISNEELMKNAPDSSDGCFRIPKVVGAVE